MQRNSGGCFQDATSTGGEHDREHGWVRRLPDFYHSGQPPTSASPDVWRRFPLQSALNLAERCQDALQKLDFTQIASRKKRVDSAPWFWLTRSSCKLLQQPPVLAS